MKQIHYFDSHAHLCDLDLFQEIEAVLARAFGGGISSILNICTSIEDLKNGKILSKAHPSVQNAGATPPHTVSEEGKEAFLIFASAAKEGFLKAIGETGLDYHYHKENKKTQHEYLIKYLHLAKETSLPVIFHCREAFEDLFSIVDQEYPKKAPAILHCFTGTVKEAEEVLKRGWYLSLSGIVTFKKSDTLREVAKLTPLDQLLIETDAPYLAPQSKRGKRNEPSYLTETAKCIAEVKGISLEEVAFATRENGKKLFAI